MSVFLVGGGPETVVPGLLAPLLAEVRAGAERGGRRPRVLLVVAGTRRSAGRFLPAYLHALDAGRDVEVEPVFLAPGRALDPAVLGGADGVVVGGGPTPAYRDALVGAAAHLQALTRAGVPYLGFSAGAMITPDAALVGGHLLAGRSVCPEEWSEERGELTVQPGLGLVGFPVDVHAAQAGTLGRVVALVASGGAPLAVAIDEDTCLVVAGPDADPGDGVVSGTGAVWVVRGSGDAVQVTRRTAT